MKLFFVSILCFTLSGFTARGNEHPTLPIGAVAPGFSLKGTDGKTYTLQSFSAAKILVIIFTCNHCPTAQAYEARIKKLVTDYNTKGVKVIAISPNDPKSVRLDELGYSEYGDGYEEMKARAKDIGINYPYLYDGENSAVAKKYGPVATPHVFIFDEKRLLQYNGRFDDVEDPMGTPKNKDAQNAIDALLLGSPIAHPVTKTFGCSIKWEEKQDLVKQGNDGWAKEPVTLESIDEAGIKKLLKNESGKLRLVNVWATWCGPCVIELPEFVNINRMYRRRDFELVTISADKPAKKDKALATLQQLQVAATNYIFNEADIYKLIELVDPKWQGALPYTLLIEPGGKIVYAKQGAIVPLQIKKQIVDHPMIGRVY